jgi:IS5 family transposase
LDQTKEKLEKKKEKNRKLKADNQAFEEREELRETNLRRLIKGIKGRRVMASDVQEQTLNRGNIPARNEEIRRKFERFGAIYLNKSETLKVE